MQTGNLNSSQRFAVDGRCSLCDADLQHLLEPPKRGETSKDYTASRGDVVG